KTKKTRMQNLELQREQAVGLRSPEGAPWPGRLCARDTGTHPERTARPVGQTCATHPGTAPQNRNGGRSVRAVERGDRDRLAAARILAAQHLPQIGHVRRGLL